MIFRKVGRSRYGVWMARLLSSYQYRRWRRRLSLPAVVVCGLLIALGSVSTIPQPAAPTMTSRSSSAAIVTTAAPAFVSASAPPAGFVVLRPKQASSQAGKPRSGAWPRCSSRSSSCVIDGDTIRLSGITIRIADIDAPETGGARCASEKELGDRATIRLAELLGQGEVTLRAYGGRDLDRYGRSLRVVERDGRSLGSILVAEGLARPWTGKRRPWC